MTDAAAPNFAEPSHFGPSHGYQPRQMVLLGAGHAHVHVLKALAANPPGVRITLVTPHPLQMYSGMVPGYVAGHYGLDDCVIPLEPLVRRGGIRWLQRSVKALDASAQTVTLDDGSTLHYDWLSVNTGPVQSRTQLERSMPGIREHGLFVRPVEAFAALWPKVVDMGATRALRVAIIGAGAGGIELAFAVRHRLPTAAVTLVTGTTPVAANYPEAVQKRLLVLLKKHKITVLQDVAVGIQADEVRLACGAGLACDVPLIATGTQPPDWLADSGLRLDEQGFIAVDKYQRSTNHHQVFAAGDVSTRIDRNLARSGVYAVRAGPALARNLGAAVAGREPESHEPPMFTLSLLSCGKRYAVASWGNYSAQGRWVWWLKNWIDRRFVAQYTKLP
ncbi:FAD-dependent oxidoreductase [Rhodoferax saidenbachensis]|nr:FAD-dependent oxidoreductase [Rhodoferax saidenbachensis]